MKRFVQNQDGATAIEYCLIASLIGFVIIGALGMIGTDLTAAFTNFAAVF
ncbi:MAG: Flp family type IVb pilin [Hyphomonadaceae bacterium]|nr:Flp family type IVb pilin [Hyphomonadaceae bacterium]